MNPMNDDAGRSAGATPAPGSYDDGLTRAMELILAEKLKHRVISEAFFALDKLWNRLREEKEGSAGENS